MDPAHNFGQIRLHLSRALFHLNHLATLIPFFVIEEDAPETPPVGFGRHLVRWTEMGPATTPTSTSSRPLVTHGQLPSSMVLNPEPHLRPLSVRRHLDADSSTPRGRQSTHRELHPPSTPATGSGDPIPMAAPRPAKRPRTTPPPPAVPTPRDSSMLDQLLFLKLKPYEWFFPTRFLFLSVQTILRRMMIQLLPLLLASTLKKNTMLRPLQHQLILLLAWAILSGAGHLLMTRNSPI